VFEGTKMTSTGLVVGLITPTYLTSDPELIALQDCDYLEFRGDLFPDGGLIAYPDFANRVIALCRAELALIFTLRLQCDGGSWPNDQAHNRGEIWDGIAALPELIRPRLFDIEIEAFSSANPDWVLRFADKGIGVLASHHRFDGAYAVDEYRTLLVRLNATGALGIKIVVTCADENECLVLMDFAGEIAPQNPLSAVFSMGNIGKWTRVVSPLLGCPLTYGYLTGGAMAPGQWSVHELRKTVSTFAANGVGISRPVDLLQRVKLWSETRKL
jgi:3-dehydroquinate dehydratase I